jgi:hypothetical protein
MANRTAPAEAGEVSPLGIAKPRSASLPSILVEDLADRRSARGMREIIAVWLIGLLCAVVGLAFVALLADPQVEAADKRFQHLKSLLDVVLGPVVTLVSSTIGFYFGTQLAQPKGDGASAPDPDR